VPISCMEIKTDIMLRVTPMRVQKKAMLKLEGKLSGPWVDELQRCWTSLKQEESPISVNLQEVSFLDGRGRSLLLRMEREGAHLVECSDFIGNLLHPDKHQTTRRKKSLRKEI
jgi:ABC-type transporter Mla MlaB component